MGQDVPAVRRSTAILRALAGSTRPMTAGALARSLDLPRSSIYQLLAVMEELGLVTSVEQPRGFVLGPGVHELGSAYLRDNRLQRLAAPLLVPLAGTHRGVAQLAVLRGWETVYLLKEQAPQSLVLVTNVGTRMPSYLTATGRAILSGLSRADVRAALGSEEFFTRTGRGPASLADLGELLRRVRAQGCAVESEEISAGVVTVAAPIADASGHPIAALGLSVEVERTEALEELSEAVRQAARSLEDRLR